MNDFSFWRRLPLEPELEEAGPSHRSVSSVRPKSVLYLAMASGGVLGTLARVEMGRLITTPENGFPWATFIVNIVGAALLGAIVVIALDHRPDSRYLQPFFATGICGSLTTFSTFIWQADNLARLGHWPLAVIYVLSSLLSGLISVTCGMRLARRFGESKNQ